ncbi:MAG TPA: NADP-dependent oxidoreductase [Puia sp.]|nr:NADP-dependent oxidoreductase [Puia sp.]
MKAIQVHQYGGAEVLLMEEVSKPIPLENEVLIQVKAAALNPVDSKIRSGRLKDIMPKEFPFIPGWEASGVIVETGKKATEFKAGDEVIIRAAPNKGGGYAEYMTAGENEIAPKPKALSFPEAAAMPLVASAAYISLFKVNKLFAGQKIVILGAAGSVGLFAVQMAKQAGAIVIGITTGDGVELVRSSGADQVVDYKTNRYVEVIQDADLALDLVGGSAQDDLWKVLKKGGLLLSTDTPPSPEKAKQYGVNASFVFSAPDKAVLNVVADMAAKGVIKPRVGRILPLAEAREAHLLMDGRKVSGKIILEMK